MTAEDLLALLPPFEARVHRRAARSIVARLAAGATLEAAGAAALDERDALASRLEGDSRRFFAASTEEQRAGALVAALEGAAGRPATRSDRRAIARAALGIDAVRERGLVRVVRLESEALVACLASHARAKREATLPSELAAFAERLCAERSWRLARAALGVLEEHAREGRSPPARALALARRLAADPSAPTWTQTAALGLAAAALGEGAIPLLATRLTPSGRADELFVREAAMRLLATQHSPEVAPLLSRAAKDPSEHVRIELAPLLARAGAFDPLRALVDPAEESSPRVRAAAALALASGCPSALEAVLLADPEEIPRRAALEAAEPLAVDHGSLRAAIDRLAVSAPWPELCLLAAEAAERIHHRCDPGAAEALAAARGVARSIPEGGAGDLPPLEPRALGRALAVLSADDHGLRAERSRSGWRVRRGDRLGRSLWRSLHEVMNPSPDKRQGHLHTVGRVAWGEIAAPPGRLAEVTATKVPGERVLVPGLSDWGRHLPTPDELLARPRGGRRSLYSAFGVSHLEFPGLWRWLAVRPLLWRGYAALCRERWSALTAAELRDRRQYLRSLERLGFRLRFEPHRSQGPAEIVALFEGGEAPREPAPMAALLLPAGELVRRFLDPSATTVNHLAAAGFAALGLFYLRLHEARRGLERARSAIPLSIGGWGTRGKSGTERLKAALFQGLGCEVLVKTTGCEAMFIHCVPGIPASETFIYRTYDKATIWEQHDLALLAERFQVDVFFWECMALDPAYVEILERHWMRDDFCTLTNTYPDHENIQGPAGIDIPRVMTRFIPRGRAVFTAEEQMTPILRDAAEEARAQLIEVRWRDHALLPADVLARFPYEEHPRNIDLVLKLAEALGVERSMALKEMADWVVPDLGVLKTYREARWRGRRLVFSNGMSANERTGFLNNWERCGFDAHRPDDAGEWIVTVVNNRADRVSRSMVFADIVVADARANAQVLIGTNLAGLNGFIAESLDRRLAELALFHADEAGLGLEELAALVEERAARALLWVKIGEVGAERLAREARAMARGLGAEGAPGPEIFERPVAAGAPSLAASREAVRPLLEPALVSWAAALGPEGADAVRHLLELSSRHAAIVSWRSRLAAALQSGAEAVERHVGAFRALLRELFLATLVPLWDESLAGDQVIDAIARACPPGFRVRLMGLQNIKGTGLDFAYRWVSFEATARGLDELAGLDGSDAVSAARRIVEAEDCGVLDLSLAEPAIRGAAERAKAPFAQELAAVADRARERLREKEAALAGAEAHARAEWARPLERVLDVWDGLWRRRRAESVLQELVDGRISHRGAAGELRKLMDRQKGGWLVKGRG
jgi:poly-gamma-glutamate synthase PgsB/CapB